jgi:hypothetical protein
MKRIVFSLIAAVLLLAPAAASASLKDTLESARERAYSTSDAELETLNRSVFSEAFMTARLIGFDPKEMEQLREDVRDLKKENAELRGMLSEGRAGASVGDDNSSLDERVSKLESMFAGLQDSLVALLNMVSAVL